MFSRRNVCCMKSLAKPLHGVDRSQSRYMQLGCNDDAQWSIIFKFEKIYHSSVLIKSWPHILLCSYAYAVVVEAFQLHLNIRKGDRNIIIILHETAGHESRCTGDNGCAKEQVKYLTPPCKTMSAQETHKPTSSLPSSAGITFRMIDLTMKSLRAVDCGSGRGPATRTSLTAWRRR